VELLPLLALFAILWLIIAAFEYAGGGWRRFKLRTIETAAHRREEQWQRETQRRQQSEARKQQDQERKQRDQDQERKRRDRERHGQQHQEEQRQTGRARQRVPEWWRVLEISPDATFVEVQQAYRLKIKQYHPDKVAGLGAELVQLAERKSRELNAALEQAKRNARS
jgi:DnaJ-domain-containing protein 1